VKAPRPSPLQQAWLVESGLSRPLLGLTLRQVRGKAAGRPASPAPAAVPAQPARVMRSGSRPAALPRPAARPRADTGQAEAAGKAAVAALADDAWETLTRAVQDCRACALGAMRDRAVPGAGTLSRPDWLIVGEAPSREDDAGGLPFQGDAGRLLHAMLLALGQRVEFLASSHEHLPVTAWSRPATAFFTHLVKCRPLGNRRPQPEEVAACRPWLDEQLRRLQPRCVLALGSMAAQSLLASDAPLDVLRGKVHRLDDGSAATIPLIATWHPAVLLMDPRKKAEAWEDLCLALDSLTDPG